MFSASSVKQLLANQDKQTKTEHGTTVGKEHVKESQGEMVGVQELEQAAPLELCESNEGYLTEHALLAESAPPFARGAPFLYRKFTVGSIIAFQFLPRNQVQLRSPRKQIKMAPQKARRPSKRSNNAGSDPSLVRLTYK